MVSKASEDLPEPETPVTTVSRPTGMENEMFLRLLTRAPRTSMASSIMSLKDCHTTQREILGLRQTHMITRILRKTKRAWKHGRGARKLLLSSDGHARR